MAFPKALPAAPAPKFNVQSLVPTASRFAQMVKKGSSKALAKTDQAVSGAGKLVAHDRTAPLGVGAIMGSSLPSAGASFAVGMIDNTEFGKTIKEKTGFLDVSDILFGVGVAVRAANFDKSLGVLRTANTALMQSKFAILSYAAGSRVPAAIANFSSRTAEKLPASHPNVSGADSGAGSSLGSAPLAKPVSEAASAKHVNGSNGVNGVAKNGQTSESIPGASTHA